MRSKPSRLSGQPALRGPSARLAAPPDPTPGAVRRGSARARGYSRAWEKASKAFIRAHPLCRGCLAMGRPRSAVLTDHVIPHRGDMARFWDSAWWQPSCAWHHDAVKQQLERQFDAGEIGAADLWLDSRTALALAWETEGRGGWVNPP
jgi:5-methylcytosine-specific restriction endonuclease McrA